MTTPERAVASLVTEVTNSSAEIRRAAREARQRAAAVRRQADDTLKQLAETLDPARRRGRRQAGRPADPEPGSRRD